MSEIVGSYYCLREKCTWEIWSSGIAYSDGIGEDSHYVAYRRENGQWMNTLVSKRSWPVSASSKLEEIFSNYIAGICTDLIDPHRHLRRK